MPGIHEPLLVNTIGHSAGALIFGIFLFLFLRDRTGSKLLRGSWLSFAAAGFAFLWDVGSLAAIVAGGNNTRNGELLIAFSFAMLSMLPAVLLHLALESDFPGLITAGYVLSSLSAVMHVWELRHPEQHARRLALIVIPVGFGLLTALSAVLPAPGNNPRVRGNNSRIVGAMCLFLFAISFVHFGSSTPDRGWSNELLIHHAGIPLALFVLLHDYRFVMLDAFIRFLANVLLAALLTFLVIRTGLKLVLVETHIVRNPLYEGLLLTALCLLLIGFSLLRNRVQRLLTNFVFRRPILETALQTIRSRSVAEHDEAGYLEWVAQRMASFMHSGQSYVVRERALLDNFRSLDFIFPIPVSGFPQVRCAACLDWAEVVVPVRFSHGEAQYILLGRRRGGRRYLSEDLSFLARISTAVAEQIERIRSIEVQRLVSEAELRALQAQVNPHFLFNALNTLYGMIPRESAGARKTVLNLADIFRYFLQSEKTFIPLNEELQIVNAYLEIERLRLGPRLQTVVEIDDSVRDVLIPILSIQPLIENAVKHGISANPNPGVLRLRIQRTGQQIQVSVHDTGAGEKGPSVLHPGTGLGLVNVRRRLQLCYSAAANLSIDATDSGTTVEFSIPAPAAGRDRADPLPLQNVSDAMSLPLADDQLQ